MTAFPSTVTSVNHVTFPAEALARALFVTGRIPADTVRFGDASLWEFVHRVTQVPAYLQRNANAEVVRSELALYLDRSEKVNLSYSLGQAMTAIFCENVLDTPWLMHLDRYCYQYDVEFAGGQQRPDLFGYGHNGWVVAEAKGRSNDVESALWGKVVSQKRMVREIKGLPPWIAIGCVSAFPSQTDSLKLYAFDPEEAEPEAVDIGLDRDLYALAYYSQFLSVMDNSPGLLRIESDRSADRATILPDLHIVGGGVAIGLETALEQRVRLALEGRTEGLADELLEILAGLNQRQFRDGSYFATSWQLGDSASGRAGLPDR